LSLSIEISLVLLCILNATSVIDVDVLELRDQLYYIFFN